MSNIESLLSVHRRDMEMLRGESRQARSIRSKEYREMNKEFNALRSKLSAELPHYVKVSSLLRGPFAFMLTLLTILSF
ncbi:hypothetical protein [Desulfovibrio sp. UCD-KL4C]|uniref:hypothetical protein n=1 Tax=Desulfovibrio sp. UCD-KL4C TaxID=2578120 RepID=UPI0025BB8387|nr:hypothetical protein [Desulfovibrio sp. UCD-KL4C]